MPITVSGLTCYPIKSCRGFEAAAMDVERMGLAHDRRMMVVTPEGTFLTQREYPRLALVTPRLVDGTLTLSAPGMDALSHSVRTTGVGCRVSIWDSRDVEAVDQGDVPAGWLSDWLGSPVRLVHIADGCTRPVEAPYAVGTGDHTGFADGFPILVLSEESLGDLNARLDAPVPMNRFRPNLVVKGCDPFAEDTWNRIRIGDVELALVKPCARCVVTTIDKDTLAVSKEPLAALGTYRRHQLGAIFGQNAIPITGGRLSLGMAVDIQG